MVPTQGLHTHHLARTVLPHLVCTVVHRFFYALCVGRDLEGVHAFATHIGIRLAQETSMVFQNIFLMLQVKKRDLYLTLYMHVTYDHLLVSVQACSRSAWTRTTRTPTSLTSSWTTSLSAPPPPSASPSPPAAASARPTWWPSTPGGTRGTARSRTWDRCLVMGVCRSSVLVCYYPTNIGIVRGTVSVATIVVVNAGVEIWLL